MNCQICSKELTFLDKWVISKNDFKEYDVAGGLYKCNNKKCMSQNICKGGFHSIIGCEELMPGFPWNETYNEIYN